MGPPPESCFYEGTVRHRRVSPARAFRYPLTLAYVDLDELPGLLGGRLIARRPGLLRFRRSDYLGDPATPLAEAVRRAADAATGTRPAGPIRVLTQLRSYGRCFNPASFYYCFDPSGDRLTHVVTEVTNTPWGERVTYVVGGAQGTGRVLGGTIEKTMHVSPLMGMDQRYQLRTATPAQTLSLHIESTEAAVRVFDATLSLTRRELTPVTARRHALRYPFESARVLSLIYAQALRARLAGARYHPHPEGAR